MNTIQIGTSKKDGSQNERQTFFERKGLERVKDVRPKLLRAKIYFRSIGICNLPASFFVVVDTVIINYDSYKYISMSRCGLTENKI